MSLRLWLRFRFVRSGGLTGNRRFFRRRFAGVVGIGILLRLLVVLAGSHLGRYRFQLRRFGLGFLRFRRRCRCGWFRFRTRVVVMPPERGFREPAVVRRIFLFIAGFIGGFITDAWGGLSHGQRAKQKQANHKTEDSFGCFAHNTSSFGHCAAVYAGSQVTKGNAESRIRTSRPFHNRWPGLPPRNDCNLPLPRIRHQNRSNAAVDATYDHNGVLRDNSVLLVGASGNSAR